MEPIQSLRGTKDVLADEINYWHFIEKKAKDLFSIANYTEIRTPILENSSLFERGIGSSTDIIAKEIYSFIDKGSRNIALRPEGTASIARSFIENKLFSQKIPQKLWYSGPMFRYERPQSGRQRQFNQLGVEVLGSFDPLIDADVIQLALNLLKELGITNCELEVNSLGTLEERVKYKSNLISYLQPYEKELDLDSQKRLYNNPLRILDTKNLKTKDILNEAPKLSNFFGIESQTFFEELCDALNSLHIGYTVNEQLVRGLDYYNHTAFEIKSNSLGAQDTLCGGGRYDELISQLGGPRTPAIGWAMGIERLLLLVKESISLPSQYLDFYIVSENKSTKLKALQLLQIFRNHNCKVEIDWSYSKFSKQFKRASQNNAIGCIIIGERELQSNSFSVKWLSSKEQNSFQMSEIENLIQKLDHYKSSYLEIINNINS